LSKGRVAAASKSNGTRLSHAGRHGTPGRPVGYASETVIAEKLETDLVLADLNIRVVGYYEKPMHIAVSRGVSLPRIVLINMEKCKIQSLQRLCGINPKRIISNSWLQPSWPCGDIPATHSLCTICDGCT